MVQKLKNMLVSVLAVALSVFALSGTSRSAAETGVVSAAVPAGTSASAETIEACGWYVSGLDDAITLSNTSGMEYIGNDYELSGANTGDIEIYFSGGEAVDTRCSFYDDPEGVNVNVSWTGTAFTASGDDDNLDFAAGDELETAATTEDGLTSLDINYAKVADACNSDWVAGTSVRILSGIEPPVTPASISKANVTTNYEPSHLTDPTFAKCSLNATYRTWIPGGRVPTNAGSDYNFIGPTLTTTVVINS